LKKTFITTVLTAVKKKNQHTRPRLLRLVDATTKEAEETATAAEAAAALSPPEEAQVSLSGSTATAAC